MSDKPNAILTVEQFWLDVVNESFSEKIKSAFSPHWGKPVRNDEIAPKSNSIRGYIDSVDTRCA